MNNNPCAVVAGRLMMAKKVLLMTHMRPDGDALGSTAGMKEFLRGQGIEADVLIPDTIPPRYAKIFNDCIRIVFPHELDNYDLFLALDCANPERLASGGEFTIEDIRERNFVCIDHHSGNSLDAPLSWIDANSSATCQMVMDMIDFLNLPISEKGASYLLTGMMTDTGCFCFSNTSSAGLRSAALAVEYGANIEHIVNSIFFSKSLNQLKFEAELIEKHLQLEFGGKFAYACITDESLTKHNFDMREDEGLIDILRGIDGVVIAMLVHHRPDGWRISLRSKNSACPVLPIAKKFGGGGHLMAAGCTIDVPEFSEVEKMLMPLVGNTLEKTEL